MKKISEMFPDDFLWGVATASYQIEGAVDEDGRGETIWDRFSHIPGKVMHNDTGDVACDAYHHTLEDVQILKELGVKAYRFSIAWSRILPAGTGEVSEAGLAYYETLIDTLLENGIEPVITLYHWDLPQKLQDRGGWMNRETAYAFLELCRIVFDRFGKKVKRWITLNEPWVVSFLGYYEGSMAPGITDFSGALQAAHTLLLAHGLVLAYFRDLGLPGEIGITLNLSPKEALTSCEEDKAAAVRCDGYANRWFLDPLFCGRYPQDMTAWYEEQGAVLPEVKEGDLELISGKIDFIGINYYNIDYTAAAEGHWPLAFTTGHASGYPTTHYGWPVTPEGIRKILSRVWEDYHPEKIFITENGSSYRYEPGADGRIADEKRIDYMEKHLKECGRAIEKGVPLAGYFVWTLMDDFEWDTGFENQFGLVYVDRKTLRRTKKDSWYWYRGMLKGEH